MSSQIKLIQNVAGTIAKSNLSKVGLSESCNMYVEQQQNADEKSTTVLMRSVQGEVLAANISGRCRNGRGWDTDR